MIDLLIYTNSEYRDVLDLFVSAYAKYGIRDLNPIILSDKDPKIPGYLFQEYDNSLSYSRRLANGIRATVKNKYFAFVHEDFILYRNINRNLLLYCADVMENNIDFIRFMKAESSAKSTAHKYLYKVDYNFAIQASLFNKDFILGYLDKYPQHNIWQLESEEKNNHTNGLYWYAGEPKRGVNHFDSAVFPCAATAVCKGKWNLEYKQELISLAPQFNFGLRGWT